MGRFVEGQDCRQGLLTQAVVAVDGSKFKAVNNRDRNYTVHKAAKRIEQVEASIDRYLAALDRADREGSDVPEVRVDQIREKIAGLRRQMRFLRGMAEHVDNAPDRQVSLSPTALAAVPGRMEVANLS